MIVVRPVICLAAELAGKRRLTRSARPTLKELVLAAVGTVEP
jgi:hypothetical protein